MRIKTVAKEMKDADVRFISLVARGANRIPFRTIKSEKDSKMLDLTKPLRILKGEKARKQDTPEVVGVVVFGQADEALMGEVRKTLTENGFSTDKVVKNEDGTVLFSAQDITPDVDTTLIRLSENMAVVVKGFSPYQEAMSESTDFNEIMAAQGYFQGVRTACEALTDTVGSVLRTSDTPEAAASNLSEALGKFSTYITTLTKGLPVTAFKAESMLTTALSVYAAKGDGKTKGGGNDACPAGVKQADWDAMSDVAKEEWKTKAAAKAKAPVEKVEPVVVEAVKAEESVKADVGNEAVLAALATMTEALKSVSGDVAGVAKAQKNLEERVEVIARKADNATEAIKSTVVAGAGAGDEPAKGSVVAKADTDPRSGCFDTAFIRRR
jgi:hypothetical protein